DVLPLASAAASRPEMRTLWHNARLRRFEQCHAFRVGEAALVLRDARRDLLAGNGVRHKDRATIVAAKRTTAVRHLGEFQFITFVIIIRHRRLFLHYLE